MNFHLTSKLTFIYLNGLQATNIVESLQFLGEWIAEQNWVGSVLDALERHRSVDLREQIDALRPLQHVIGVGRQHLSVRTLPRMALKLLTRCNFYRWFVGSVGDEEIHGNIFAVHSRVDVLLYVSRHRSRIRVVPILVMKRSSGEHHRDLNVIAY